MKKQYFFGVSLLLALCAAGLSSCETAQHRMEREIAAALPGGDFRAAARYAAYVKGHGEEAQALRNAAAQAAWMRLHIAPGTYKIKDTFLPLSTAEKQAVRQLLAQVEETPCHDFPMWLEERYAAYVTGPWPSPPLLWASLEFLSADGKVLHSFYDYDGGIGDKKLEETYRTARFRPAFMLPTGALERWNKQPFLQRGKQKLDSLYKQEAAR